MIQYIGWGRKNIQDEYSGQYLSCMYQGRRQKDRGFVRSSSSGLYVLSNRQDTFIASKQCMQTSHKTHHRKQGITSPSLEAIISKETTTLFTSCQSTEYPLDERRRKQRQTSESVPQRERFIRNRMQIVNFRRGEEKITKIKPNTSFLLSQPSSWHLSIKFPPVFGILPFPVRPAEK